MDAASTLAMRARKRRDELGKTQAEVAERIRQRGVVSVTRRDISRVETGELTTPHFVEELAIALEVPAIWLASGMTAREHEQILSGTLAAAGVGTVGVMADVDSFHEIETERQNFSRALLFLAGLIVGASLVLAWGFA